MTEKSNARPEDAAGKSYNPKNTTIKDETLKGLEKTHDQVMDYYEGPAAEEQNDSNNKKN
ncbi:DUF4025 domain-containing protein [Peribacillus sp. SCS-37]|uniref:DUF4025 domain-containing protein n=1 Tax=Paraperibacillus esterisolvens TaxID=3115296 RepID=UPI0039058A63